MPHLMIDLETLSTAPTAAVTQLGWCLFDPERGEPDLGHSVVHLNVEVQMREGLTVDWSTVSWWMTQDEAARRLLVSTTDRHYPSAALARLDEAVDWTRVSGVWSHGATFDLVILESLYRKAGRKTPWGFRDARDTRTLLWAAERTAGRRVLWPHNPVKHSAEADAVCQAGAICNAYEMLVHGGADRVVVLSGDAT